MPATLAAVVVPLVCMFVLALFLQRRLADLQAPLTKLQDQYRDALSLISLRADRAEAATKAALDQLAAFERAVGDKRAMEAALAHDRLQTDFLRERVTELQRAVIGLSNPKLEATLVGQTNRAGEKEEPFVPPPNRWQAAAGTAEPLVAELTRLNPSTTSAGTAEPLVAELTRLNPSTTFRGADLRLMAARESGFPPESA